MLCFTQHEVSKEGSREQTSCTETSTSVNFSEGFCFYFVLLNCDFHQCQTPQNIKRQTLLLLLSFFSKEMFRPIAHNATTHPGLKCVPSAI